MTDTLQNLAHIAIIAFVLGKPLILLFHLRGSGELKGWRSFGGAYREAPFEEKARAQATEIVELKATVANQATKIAALEDLVNQLWERNESDRKLSALPTPSALQRVMPCAAVVSMLTATAVVIGPLMLLPGHAGPESLTDTTPTMHLSATSGGETPARAPRATLPRARYCMIHDAFVVLPFRTVDLTPMRLAPQDADRPWTLWFYPEKDPPHSIVYIRH